MDWKKFAGTAILIGIAILIYVGMNVYVDAKYDEGDTVEDGDMIATCGAFLLLVLSCLGSIVWFAFALEEDAKDGFPSWQFKVIPNATPVPLAGDSHSTIRAFHDWWSSCVIFTGKSSSQNLKAIRGKWLASSLLLVVLMFVLMICLGIHVGSFWNGFRLGGSGGTCDETCESLGSAAEFSMWASLLLFPCGLIALARPWSWFSSGQDIRDPVVKVRMAL